MICDYLAQRLTVRTFAIVVGTKMHDDNDDYDNDDDDDDECIFRFYSRTKQVTLASRRSQLTPFTDLHET